MWPLLTRVQRREPWSNVGPEFVFTAHLGIDSEVQYYFACSACFSSGALQLSSLPMAMVMNSGVRRRRSATPSAHVVLSTTTLGLHHMSSRRFFLVDPGAVGLAVNHALAFGVPAAVSNRSRNGPFLLSRNCVRAGRDVIHSHLCRINLLLENYVDEFGKVDAAGRCAEPDQTARWCVGRT
jgi:hypothetical protein